MKLTPHDLDLIGQLREHREDLRTEGRVLREMMHTKFKQADSLSDRVIAEKFEVSLPTIQRHFRRDP